MIKQTLSQAKRRMNNDGRLKCTITYDSESEDLHYNLEWIKMIIQGPEDMELEEYNAILRLYIPLEQAMKKEFPKDDNLSKQFKTKILSTKKVEEAYKQGFGAMTENNISNKLLEMGILTTVELIKDYGSRETDIMPSF